MEVQSTCNHYFCLVCVGSVMGGRGQGKRKEVGFSPSLPRAGVGAGFMFGVVSAGI